MIGHVAPEAALGGRLAALQDDDVISIDVEGGRLTIEGVDIAARLKEWSAPEPNYRKGGCLLVTRCWSAPRRRGGPQSIGGLHWMHIVFECSGK
jgi:dihydroxyacid dehydratase/phosphogluconate dehydratase